MPIRIALCDDETEQRSCIKTLLYEWKQNRVADIEMREYRSAEQFLFDYEEHTCDLLLLDIEMVGTGALSRRSGR
ncbi:MAG: hypothetical protein IJ512_08740 [Ruminococcus sp.]|nr:hypothetical protein [Ruminococcus sp.]